MEHRLILKKNQIFHLFHELEEHSARATFRNPKISLFIGKNWEVHPHTNTQKIPILNQWMNWKNLCPNLSFTVENKIGNLRKIRLFKF